MSFGQDFLKGFVATGLKDYAHASKTFLSNGSEFIPRYKFLFHVYFTINTGQIPRLQNVFGSGDQATIGLMVKTAQLPSYEIDVDTMNQYNRKRLVQTKINYNPVQIVFNDDQGDLVRNMWYNYYSYYYKDPSQKYDAQAVTSGTVGNIQTLQNGFGYNTKDIYANNRQVNDWGYVGESYSDGLNNTTSGTSGKPPFFRDITIYGFSQKKFVSYILINPMITSWMHDTYDYGQDNGTMINTMTIRYETVKYNRGAVGGATPSNAVPGFANPAQYDTIKSSLARPGSTATVLGQGGLIDAGIGILDDLQALGNGGGVENILGAVQKGSATYQTFKGKNIASIFNADAQVAAQDIIRTSLPGAMRQVVGATNGMLFPKPPTTTLGPNVGPTVQVSGK
jgi:hypothetical protein